MGKIQIVLAVTVLAQQFVLILLHSHQLGSQTTLALLNTPPMISKTYFFPQKINRLTKSQTGAVSDPACPLILVSIMCLDVTIMMTANTRYTSS